MDFAKRGGDSRHCSNGEEEEDYNSSRRLSSSFNLSSQSETVDDRRTSSGAGDPKLVPAADIEKEHMFDKVVTPSDVGKLNRLVIPKQHAEKYFPLDSSTNEKGLLLNFEDRNGKPWRFRYSYWNSSQSYVMTKGWSRFVKEKRLDAGDTVSFGRGVGETGRDRLFIDWKRRPEVHTQFNIQSRHPTMQNSYTPMMSFSSPVMPWSRFGPISSAYDHHHHHRNQNGVVVGGGFGYTTAADPYLYLKPSVAGPLDSHPLPRLGLQMQYGGVGVGGGYYGLDGGNSAGGGPSRLTIVFDSVPVGHSSMPTSANSKRVRLFGVNLDCSSSSSRIGDPCALPATAHLSQLLPPPLSLQLGLGDASTTTAANMIDSPSEDKQQPMSLELDI